MKCINRLVKHRVLLLESTWGLEGTSQVSSHRLSYLLCG